MKNKSFIIALVLMAAWVGCRETSREVERVRSEKRPPKPVVIAKKSIPRLKRDFKVVHVFVALCDNKNQGIARVSKALGNGQDPRNNLYWGAMYGVKTFFRRSSHWQKVSCPAVNNDPAILKRVMFRSTKGPKVFVLADAYDGAKMKRTLEDFLTAAGGQKPLELKITDGGKNITIQAGGYSDLVCFVGHNGLMDCKVGKLTQPDQSGKWPRSAFVLCCVSKSYFADPLSSAGCTLLLGTTGRMAPEAYILDAALRSWAANGSSQSISKQAAYAYAKYQKCSRSAALRLFDAK